MKKRGFTLVELLGVIVILAIVLGLAVAGYLGLNGQIDKVYYRSVEESMVIPGSDYFNYNKGEQPSIFGDEVKVTAKILQEGGYIENELVDSDGNSCDLENSYVGAYKDSKDKTNYYTCLACGEYKTETLPCAGVANYSLGVRANGKNTNNIYDIKLGKWINENIVLTFETLNDMTTVVLEDSSDRQVGSCELKTKNNVKTCTIEVSASGDYQAYAKKNDVTTRKEDIKIQIDKTNPTFNIANTGSSNKIDLDLGSNTSIAVNNEVLNINDPESKVKTIEYSFEKSGQKAKYQTVSLSNSFKVNKTLGLGTYELIVRVTNNAGGSTTQKVVYELYKKIAKPTAAKYCQANLVYSGSNQTVTSASPEGLTFSNNTGIDAGKYIVTAKLNSNYRYDDNTTGNVTFECQIGKKKVDVKWSVGQYTYNGNKQGPSATATSGITNETLNLTTTKETNAGNYTSTATLTSVSGGRGNVNNYELTNTTASYAIKKADPNLVLNSYSGKIKASEKIDVTASAKVSGTFTNTASNKNASVTPSSSTGTGETITVTGLVSGDCDITVKFVPSNNNYENATKTYKVTVTTVKYTINYWQMNNDGVNYTLVKTVTGEGNIGAQITGEIITYQNFESPTPITITLNSDTTKNVINYYYTKTCFGAACDFCGKGSPIGSCFYEHQEELGLWSSNLATDTKNQNVRYIGLKSTSEPNNYLCFNSSDCSKTNHRIIGVFTTSHRLRIVNTKKYTEQYDDTEAAYYNYPVVLARTIDAQKSVYNKNFNGSVTWWNLIGKTHHALTTTRYLYDKTTEYLLNTEEGGSGVNWDRKMDVSSTSDVILATGRTDLKYSNYKKVAQSWLFGGEEWTYHRWNTAFAYLIGSDGKLCANNSGGEAGHTTCGNISGYYSYVRQYRLNFTLKDQVLFCGGSGTKTDQYKIGWGSCTY